MPKAAGKATPSSSTFASTHKSWPSTCKSTRLCMRNSFATPCPPPRVLSPESASHFRPTPHVVPFT
ncbi:hypothetical protein PAXRUDRAFT_269617 [Paxillus rubicundulus Ve08.2h10]|uniref:Uncharacterized protein n=1 Tax=Paxillus rubicundulus Ve08.2h10 TaxID=930991 RepID=A0A0D0C9T0_9AGAM|nr:hypothetical protein PAXRUDRAFT_269617 [Paxillus rubicundulus Ve08.2h10]